MTTEDQPTVDQSSDDKSAMVLGSMDRMFHQLITRLDGMTADEYLWEPVDGVWSVRAEDQGPATVDGAGVREIDPAPITTIAWRIWHLTFDCFDEYTRRLAGNVAAPPATFTLDPDEAVSLLQAKWGDYRAAIASRDSAQKLGEKWDHFAEASTADMAMHASNELVHHGAEIALLRDLYRAKTS